MRHIVEAFAPLVASAKNEKQAQEYSNRMMYYVSQAKLPRRKRKRPFYPRAVWGKGELFPR